MSSSIEKMYMGRRVAVVEVNGGWTTILDGMKQVKVRNGELAAVKESKMPDQPSPPRDRPNRAATLAKHDAEVRAAKAGQTPTLELDGEAEQERKVNPDLAKYKTHETRTASGRRAIDRDDEVAAQLRGSSLDEVYAAASDALGQSVEDLRAKYGHLNPGMQRMNLGNRMRGAASKSGA